MSRFLKTRSLIGGSFLLLLMSGRAPGHTLPLEHTVEIKQMQFQPAELKVQKGDIVIFVNRDMVEHNVTEASHKSWSSSALPAGSSWKLVVTQSANYYCTIHPVMKGKLLVK